MSFFITNESTEECKEIKIINHHHESKLIKVISNILGDEPDYKDNGSFLEIYLTSRQINTLYRRAKETGDHLARIIDVEELDALRGIKGCDY